MFPAINVDAELDASVPARRRSGGTRTSRAAASAMRQIASAIVSTGDDSEWFGVRLEPHRDAVVIAPRGELDMNVVDQLDAAFEEALAAGYRRIVIDLSELLFMDSTGLHSVLGMQRSAERDGIDFAIVPGDDAVQHVFELTQTVNALPFVDPRELGLD